VLSLWGDASDNIPGIPGIGEKTAKTLIKQFGSLDTLLDELDQIKNPKIKKRIQDNLDILEMSRKLATIERDLSVDIDLEALSLSSPDRNKAVPLFQELEFASFLQAFLPSASKNMQNYQTILKEYGTQLPGKSYSKAGICGAGHRNRQSFPIAGQAGRHVFFHKSRRGFLSPFEA